MQLALLEYTYLETDRILHEIPEPIRTVRKDSMGFGEEAYRDRRSLKTEPTRNINSVYRGPPARTLSGEKPMGFRIREKHSL